MIAAAESAYPYEFNWGNLTLAVLAVLGLALWIAVIVANHRNQVMGPLEEERSRGLIRAELREIELHRPHHIINHNQGEEP